MLTRFNVGMGTKSETSHSWDYEVRDFAQLGQRLRTAGAIEHQREK